MIKPERYFVVGLTEDDFRPSREAEFRIEILNEFGEGERVVFFNYASDDPVGFLHADGGQSPGPNWIPRMIVNKCRNRLNWPGYYMDEDGEITLSSLDPPDEELLSKEREAPRKRTP